MKQSHGILKQDVYNRAGQEYFVLKYICTFQVQFVTYLECTQVHFWEIVSTSVLKYISNVLRFSSTFRVHLSTLSLFYRIIFLIQKWVNGADGVR